MHSIAHLSKTELSFCALACSGIRVVCGHVRVRVMCGISWACPLDPSAPALTCTSKSMMEKLTRESSSRSSLKRWMALATLVHDDVDVVSP